MAITSAKTPTQIEGSGNRSSRLKLTSSEAAALLAVSAFAPLMVWVNSAENAGLPGFLAMALVVFAVALLIRGILVRLGLNPLGASYSVGTFVFAFTNGGLLLDRGVGRLLVLAGSVLISVVAYRLSSNNVLQLAVLWGVIFLIGYPWLVWATTRPDPGAVTVSDPAPLEASLVAPPSDVVFVVLDGYANRDVLETLYDYDIGEFAESLSGYGFDVSELAMANYGRTRFSVSSVMQLDYPVTEGALTGADLDHFLDIVGGDSVMANWLVDAGYEFTYVESGWFGTKCGDNVETCVVGPWPSESLYDFTNRTLLKDLPGFETGRSFSNGATAAMEWMVDGLPDIFSNGEPDLVYVHVLAPHPPLFLDESCVSHPQDGHKGFTIAQPGQTAEELDSARQWYGRQVDCVNTNLITVAEAAQATGAALFFIADHGPDSLGQLFIPGAEWSEEQRYERLGALVAARVPGCDMSEIESVVNVGRRFVSCVSDTEMPDLPSRAYDSESTTSGDQIIELPAPRYGPGT